MQKGKSTMKKLKNKEKKRVPKAQELLKRQKQNNVKK